MNIENLTSAQLRQAADLKEQIEALEQQLAGLSGSGRLAPTPVAAAAVTQPAKRGPKTMSAAHKAKIRAAQQIRWAKFHAAKAGTETAVKAGPFKAVPVKPVERAGLSAAGKARIIAAQKARWAKYNAAKPAP